MEFIADDRIEWINGRYFRRKMFVRYEFTCWVCGEVIQDRGNALSHIAIHPIAMRHPKEA